MLLPGGNQERQDGSAEWLDAGLREVDALTSATTNWRSSLSRGDRCHRVGPRHRSPPAWKDMETASPALGAAAKPTYYLAMRQLGAMDALMYYTDAAHAPSTIGALELLDTTGWIVR